MRRRKFVALTASLAVWPLPGRSQQTAKVSGVALISQAVPISKMAGSNPTAATARAFVHALRQLGYIEGQNLILERRSAEGRYDRFGEIAADLIRQGIDVIVTSGNDMARETARVAVGVPIVMGLSSGPVEAGLVASLARPGGYITGFTVNTGPEIETKRLEMLKEAVPRRCALFSSATRTIGRNHVAPASALQRFQ